MLELGNVIGIVFESFCIIILCISLLNDVRDKVKKTGDEKRDAADVFLYLLSLAWLLWRVWITATFIIDYLKQR